MARPATFNKRDNEKKKQTKRLEKQKRKDERKTSGKSSMDDMIAYVDENGMISSTPPDLQKKEKINQEDILIAVPKKEDVEAAPLKGRVEHFNSDKGYGFIKSLGTTDKYFFHISNAPENIAEGNTVSFELERGARGMNAINIEIDK
ncbi:cold shock domain-containing protein [Paludibacter sp. 221]|uniref:cold-shock protein n=1 Tax=Paludibacter sp. 221 TaxID=2302939 RepID=UPI0013D6F1D6|nr:cold shock domain-containing protein [Paludibacter sp. 221]NDV47784.1 cold shock domain-containing protein [Paludibacter sp. 221]